MNIKFTSFSSNDTWVSGLVNNGEYHFEAKLFDDVSVHGIDRGRVSKLLIRKGNTSGWYGVIANYDRGWDIEPETEYEQLIFINVLEFLETAPIRFE